MRRSRFKKIDRHLRPVKSEFQPHVICRRPSASELLAALASGDNCVIHVDQSCADRPSARCRRALPGAGCRRALLERARALLKRSPLIDGHNDYPWALREKGRARSRQARHRQAAAVDHDRHPAPAGPAASAASSGRSTSRSSCRARRRSPRRSSRSTSSIGWSRKYPETFELALTADDVERIFKQGKIASLIGMEGGHSIDNSLAALRHVLRASARAT